MESDRGGRIDSDSAESDLNALAAARLRAEAEVVEHRRLLRESVEIALEHLGIVADVSDPAGQRPTDWEPLPLPIIPVTVLRREGDSNP